MTKKHFIELADQIREHNRLSEHNPNYAPFTLEQLKTIAAACYRSNNAFKRDRWISYIKGECGPNGGAR